MPRVGTKPRIVNVSMPIAGSEYSYKLPQGTGALMLRFRNGDGKYCYISGESATNYLSLEEGQNYYEETVNLDNTILYFQSDVNDVVAEVLIWQINTYN
jgi:hypothetical protein